MSDIAIKVENLSKKYQIGARQRPYRTLRETLTGAASAPFRRLQSAFRRSEERASKGSDEFWALRDVSFEVRRGEVVGVIGRNGAGKSTLLKILSRITEPSGGYADIYGRVGSLLEVGTGFHPELTGRENVYLNGAILGMRRAEIDRQFDAIVDFAEVERFVDTPVKHYSSGMYLRLAFAVAAHLEPEILIIDEVLAVGDIAFQQKCLGKMGEVAKEGRTVLFVSHNMAAVRSLCQRSIVLKNGNLMFDGDSSDVISKYMRRDLIESDKRLSVKKFGRNKNINGVNFVGVRILDVNNNEIHSVLMGDCMTIEAEYLIDESIRNPEICFSFINQDNQIVMRAFTYESNDAKGKVGIDFSGIKIVRCVFDRISLMHGIYSINLWIGDGTRMIDYVESAVYVEVVRNDVYKTGHAPDARQGGVMFELHRWEFR